MKPAFKKPIKLSTGQLVMFRKPTGRDMASASKHKSRVTQSYALIALASMEDPASKAGVLTLEQIMELGLDDIEMLSEALMAAKKGKDFDQESYELEKEMEDEDDE